MEQERNIVIGITDGIDAHERRVEVNTIAREALVDCAYCGNRQQIERLPAHERDCESIRTSDAE